MRVLTFSDDETKPPQDAVTGVTEPVPMEAVFGTASAWVTSPTFKHQERSYQGSLRRSRFSKDDYEDHDNGN